jgi:hypothetical protein
MGDGITEGLAFSGPERVRLANMYAIFGLITIAASTVYWKLIGAM